MGNPYKQKLRLNYRTNEWDGQMADGRQVHVSNELYWRMYHAILKEHPREYTWRAGPLRQMTTAPFWAEQAEAYSREMGGQSPDLYITGTEHE